MKKTLLLAVVLLFSTAFCFSSCSTSELDDVNGGPDAIEQVSAVPTTPGKDGYYNEPEVVCGECNISYWGPSESVIPGCEHLIRKCSLCGKWYYPAWNHEEDPVAPVEPEEPWDPEQPEQPWGEEAECEAGQEQIE